MDKCEVLEIIREYRQALIKLFPNSLTYLFGSYAKECQREMSDIDVAVIVPKLSENYLWEDSPKLWRLSGDINSLIEPVLLEKNENNPLYQEIIKTGILIE